MSLNFFALRNLENSIKYLDEVLTLEKITYTKIWEVIYNIVSIKEELLNEESQKKLNDFINKIHSVCSYTYIKKTRLKKKDIREFKKLLFQLKSLYIEILREEFTLRIQMLDKKIEDIKDKTENREAKNELDNIKLYLHDLNIDFVKLLDKN